MTVHIVVLRVPDCPNADLAHQRCTEATRGQPDATITMVVVADDDDAARTGMRGSPTILVNGHDPFNDTTTPTSCSCRLRPGTDPVPTVEEIRRAAGRRGVT